MKVLEKKEKEWLKKKYMAAAAKIRKEVGGEASEGAGKGSGEAATKGRQERERG